MKNHSKYLIFGHFELAAILCTTKQAIALLVVSPELFFAVVREWEVSPIVIVGVAVILNADVVAAAKGRSVVGVVVDGVLRLKKAHLLL